MTTFPSEPSGPLPREVARRLRALAGEAARRPPSVTRSEIDLLIAAAQLIELAYMIREPVAGEGAA